MKKLVFFAILTLSTISAFAATDRDFCLAQDKIIPYSPFSRFSVTCNGVEIEETALFGRGLQEKFEKKLKANGFKIVLKLDNRLLISKKSKSELAVDEICLVSKAFGMNRTIVECDSSPALTLMSTNDSVVVQFAKSYNYNFLQKPQSKTDFSVLSR